jgi:hypothetical protein
MTDERIKQDVTKWVVTFMRDRFPQGLNDKLDELVREIIFDAYLDGVAYGQEVVKDERPRIIIPARR